jgi:hypothetical protein
MKVNLALILIIVITLAVLYATYEFYYKYQRVKPFEIKGGDMEKLKIIWVDNKDNRHVKYQIEDKIIETYYNDKPLVSKVEFKNNNLNELLTAIKNNVENKDLARLILAIAIQEQSAHNPLKTHPNQNYWGIQTDAGRWFASEYIDYRFLAVDNLTNKIREFAGFNTLDRAVLFMKNMLLESFRKNAKGNKIPSKEEFPNWYWLYWRGIKDVQLDEKTKIAYIKTYNEASKYV